MSDTSRPSASGITEPTEPEADGLPGDALGSWLVNDSPDSTRPPTTADEYLDRAASTIFPGAKLIDITGRWWRVRLLREMAWIYLWDLRARVKHVFGVHTWVETQELDLDRDTMQFIGDHCWMCGRQA